MEHVQVKGQSYSFSLQGSGKVTVIFETGFGAESSEWNTVLSTISEPAKLFTYDRAGRGGSSGPQSTRDTLTLCRELDSLLEAVSLGPPYVLVGHSFGGLLTRLFAHQRRTDVQALVLVESMHRRQFAEISPKLPEAVGSEEGALTKMRTFWREGWKNPSATPELIDLQASFEIDSKVSRLDLPLHVISAASFQNMPFIEGSDIRRVLQESWNALQAGLLQLSGQARHTYIRNSGHFVQRDAPDLIADVITATLRAISSR